MLFHHVLVIILENLTPFTLFHLIELLLSCILVLHIFYIPWDIIMFIYILNIPLAFPTCLQFQLLLKFFQASIIFLLSEQLP